MKINFKFLLLLLIAIFGPLVSFSIFLIFFYKAGFIVTPFTPSELIFFTSGTLAALGYSNIFMLFLTFAIVSMTIGILYYQLGIYFGPRIFKYSNNRLLKKKHIENVHYFYEKYGSNIILVSRFIPIIKSFIPFIAGIGKMDFLKFFTYNAFGAIVWVGIYMFGGYYFAKIPFVKENFPIIAEAIIIGSFVLVVSNLFMYFKKKQINKQP